MTKNNVIYVNGCSFTEGCDVGEHLYPFFEKYYSIDEITSENSKVRERKQIASQEQKSKFIFNQDNEAITQKIQKFEIERRWTSHLSKILDRPVLNLSSYGGSSMYSIAHRTMADLSALQQQGYIISDVIIQVTAPRRYSFFGNTGIAHEPQRRINDRYYHIRSGNYLNPNGLRKSLFEELFTAETNEMANYRWLHEVYMLKHTVEAVTRARVILVDSAFYIKNIAGINIFNFDQSSWLKRNSYDYLLDFKKTLDEEIKLSMFTVISTDEPDTITTSMHVTEKVHRRFAEAIQETYFK
jgi:hypothetical protein